MYTLIARTDYPKEMDANPTESLNVMICELKDPDSNMTAVGSGLRLAEQVSTVHRTIFDPVTLIPTLYLCETSHCFRMVPWSFHPLLSIPFSIGSLYASSAVPWRPRRPNPKIFSPRSSFLHVLPVAPASSSEISSLRWHRILVIRGSLPKSALDCLDKAVKF